ncbi:hypothetical protein [Nocardioides sp. B-3]|uniref:hypothetical protein n=1 Tax=Nocardioides sp. B-3 TaxID=2895565 RepID=UPI002152D690|nr:hypothetical protein [Nocardioides sp. B-3]UUZ60497.1 hypothetical protein LP418_06380 [Nocardioides sp. B-3]
MIEKDGGIGGTRRANTYPGAACDVPSQLYSFSFAPNPSWSMSFSPSGRSRPTCRRWPRTRARSTASPSAPS